MRVAVAPFALLAWLLATAAPGVTVRITSPPPGQAAYGVVKVHADVQPAGAIAEVTFAVDGRLFATLQRPPFEASTDVGPDNVEHRFEVVAATAAGETGRAELVTPRIEADQEVQVELRQLFVTVHREGKKVLDLRPEELRVFDDDEEQRIVTFAGGDTPFTAVLLLDSSSSMEGARLKAAVDGARTFAAAMRRLDEAKLLVFSDRLLHTTPFSGVGEVLLAGLGTVSARGGTAVNDNLFLALSLLDGRQGRRLVVLLSDGADSHSALAMSDVIRKARESQALVYWIRLEPEGKASGSGSLVSPWHDAAWYRNQMSLLDEAAGTTGGRVVVVRRTDEIAPAFAEIVRELREQYTIGYYPSGRRHDGRWRKVSVKVSRGLADKLTHGAYQVSTRGGYVDE